MSLSRRSSTSKGSEKKLAVGVVVEMEPTKKQSQAQSTPTATGSVSEVIQRWKRRAAFEWLVIVAWAVFGVTLYASFRPHHQCVPGLHANSRCGDDLSAQLNKPHKTESVSDALLIAICALLPLLVFGSSALYLHVFTDECVDWRITALQFERFFRVTLLCQSLTFVATNMLKTQVGSPRPNFYHALADDRSQNIRNIRLSFPSGHSSSIFTSAMLCTLWLLQSLLVAQRAIAGMSTCTNAKRVRVSTQSGNDANDIEKQHASDIATKGCMTSRHFRSYVWYHLFLVVSPFSNALCATLVLWPVAVAMIIAATRITDFWHFPVDVTTGALLGSVVALFVWRIYKLELNTPL